MGERFSKLIDDSPPGSDLRKVISIVKTTNTLVRRDTAGKIARLAAKKGNLDVIRFVAERVPAALAEANSSGKTVAHIAARTGRLDIIQFVAQKRPSVLLEEGNSIVDIARKFRHLDVVLYVVRENPSVLANEDEDENTVLHLLVEENYLDIDMLSFFVDEKVIPLSKTNKKRETIAHIAARIGNLDFIRFLALRDPMLLSMKDYQSNSVIQLIAYYAAENGRLQMVQHIIEQSPNALRAKFPPFCTAACVVAIRAARGGFCDIVRCVVEKYPDVLDHNDPEGGGTLAQIAARNGHLNVVRYLVERKPSFATDRDQNYNTLLHLAAMGRASDMDSFKFLVEEKGVPLFFQNRQWETVLDIAARNGDTNMIRYGEKRIRCTVRKLYGTHTRR